MTKLYVLWCRTIVACRLWLLQIKSFLGLILWVLQILSVSKFSCMCIFLFSLLKSSILQMMLLVMLVCPFSKYMAYYFQSMDHIEVFQSFLTFPGLSSHSLCLLNLGLVTQFKGTNASTIMSLRSFMCSIFAENRCICYLILSHFVVSLVFAMMNC